MDIAVVGTGDIAGAHAAAWAELGGQARIVAATDVAVERLDAFCTRWSVPRRYADLDGLLAAERLGVHRHPGAARHHRAGLAVLRTHGRPGRTVRGRRHQHRRCTPVTTEPTDAGLTLSHEHGRSLWIQHRGQPLLRYVYAPWDDQLESPRPYFHPIRTLGGDEVSLSRPHDHVWHKGIAWSLPNVGPDEFACAGPAPFFDTELPVSPGSSVTRRYAVAVADGDAGADGVPALAAAALIALKALT